MSEPYLGEIQQFGGTFAPSGWAFCHGQLLPISQNTALFSLLGTTYGGDGETTFALPDLRGRVPLHTGTGSGLSPRPLGQEGGAETVALQAAEAAAHTHELSASTDRADDNHPTGARLGVAATDVYVDGGTATSMASPSVTSTGDGQAHANVMPFQVVQYIIALTGVFPSEN